MYNSTEITSATIPSDNPLHQQLLFPYVHAASCIGGDVLEVGCGWGRGIETLLPVVKSYTGIDKNKALINHLQQEHPQGSFITMRIPPLSELPTDFYDFVLCFQVIEHVREDQRLVEEMHRVLKPGGKLLLTTINRFHSLTRNPWHVREYTDKELMTLLRRSFVKVKAGGVTGNERVKAYYAENKRTVEQLTRYDWFDLQHRLPSWTLRWPYEFLNRWNRNRVAKRFGLASHIRHTDFHFTNATADALDLYFNAQKYEMANQTS
ncbi:class I SAM-dependent methyltransferase [Larkinella soli]|uniref:class I SAM-dependent methyltransferase n=1 Tax=Larkinella soli TaxID=1770527 RepID=UPI000FFB6BD5|nr:class I SAM-dependent methyltransferase [Larkinella soli]